MDLEQIKAVIAMMKENDLTEFSMEHDGLKIRIRRGPEGFQQTVTVAPPPVPAPTSLPAVALPAAPAPASAVAAPAAGLKYIASPMVGTLYHSPSPDAPAYVEVGSVVDEETVVCIIEAMKVMNEIKAEVKGVITEVLSESAKPVEFGQKLFAVRPK